MRRALTTFAALTLLTPALASCGDGFGGFLISDAKEVEIGQGVAQEVEKQYKILTDDDPVSVWARQLVAPLSDGSKEFRDPENFGGYKVHVIYDDELVNAFAAPGGFTYISTGLILQASSCAEIGGVMGHELSHVILRHSVKQIEDQFAVSEIADFFLGDSLAGDAATTIYAFLSNTQFSQEHEAEADEYGLQVAHNAGYNPYGLADFFQRLLDLEKASGGVQIPTFLSSHPATEDRVAAVKAKIAELYGDAVKPGVTPSYECVGTTETLAAIRDRITAGNLAVREGTGTEPAPAQ